MRFKQILESERSALWAVILLIAISVLLSYIKFPLHSAMVGDESYYVQEVSYLANYGLFNALSQGTSVVYSILIFITAKIFFVSYLVAGRLLNIIFFVISCYMLLACLAFFKDLKNRDKYVSLLLYVILYRIWMFKALPDALCITFFWMSMYKILSAKGNRDFIISGILIFIAFAIKPIALFTVPGLILLIIFRYRGLNGGAKWVRSAVFTLTFFACFLGYQTPGFITFHKLMLEDKSHSYSGITRIPYATSWGEKNIYFEAYNINKKKNKWAVSFDEVDSFKKMHPEIKLNMGFTEYVTTHFDKWSIKTFEKLFWDIPYAVQSGFFFSKWTVINKYINNMAIIFSLTLILMLSICVYQRQFLRDNFIMYLPVLLFYVILCMYCIPQLESNWLLVGIAFLSLPVSKTLNKYINYYVVLILQLGFIFLS